LLALFCLGCLSQFIPLPARPYLLPLLPIITTGLMTMIKPRLLSLGLSCTLWLSSYLAFSRFGGIDNQMPLFLTFLATYSYWALIHRIVASRIALAIVHTELTAAHRQLQEYSAQVEKLSAIDERNRIARDIHDTLGHALTLLSVQLETAVQFESCGDLRLHEKLLQARQVARTCLTDIRHAIEALRPDEASTGTLQDQLRRLVEEFEMAGCQTQIALDVEEVTHSLNPDLCQTLYRCAQEALTNIRKHAQATRVLLRLSTNEEQVELTVLDNGQGSAPSPEQSASGFGLRGMRERVALLDGRLSAGPASELGWRVEVVLPLISPERTKGSVLGVHQTKQEV
jgi:signal transduction histidine kinase